MKKWILILSVLCSAAYAQNNALLNLNAQLQLYIKNNWQIQSIKTGDLNSDGVDDVAMILQEQDPLKFTHNTKMGYDTINTNQRELLVFINQGNTLQLVAQNNVVLSSAGNLSNPCQDDPVTGSAVQIQAQKLFIHLENWQSCNLPYASQQTLTFQLSKQQLNLIGFDEFLYQKNTGEIFKTSVNFLTQTALLTTGNNMFIAASQKTTIQQRKLENNTTISMQNFNIQTLNQIMY